MTATLPNFAGSEFFSLQKVQQKWRQTMTTLLFFASKQLSSRGFHIERPLVNVFKMATFHTNFSLGLHKETISLILGLLKAQLFLRVNRAIGKRILLIIFDLVLFLTADSYNFSLKLAFSQVLGLIHLNYNHEQYCKQKLIIKHYQIIAMMIEQSTKIIHLTNVTKKKEYHHRIADEHKRIRILTWYEILEIIELYQPTADLNKILIQVKRDQVWQYISNTFSYNLRMEPYPQLLIRYKLYDTSRIGKQKKVLVEEKLAKCQSYLKQYEQKFNINGIDINVFWASPIFSRDYKEGSSRTFPVNWKICPDYINQLGKALRKSQKKVYFTTNLFNKDSFASKSYSIVYLVCQTQCYENRTGTYRKEYFVGEANSGELVEIYPKKIHEIFKEATIQLLIFHTSYPYYHLQQIQSCQGIKNILLIKSSPIFHSDSTSYFLNRFFSELMSGQSLKDAHKKVVKQVQSKFNKDEMCCCYHTHNIECQFHHLKCSFTKFTTDHYRKHKIDKKEKSCCCPIIGEERYDYQLRHSIDQKFQFAKTCSQFQTKTFEFENGQLQGDAIYLKGFQTRQNLLGNKHILPKLIEAFQKPKSNKKEASQSKILNIYNKMCEDKLIFIQNLANFLIRRKIFVENRIYQLKTNQTIVTDKVVKNPKILYTLFCDQISHQYVKKLKQLEVNIIIVSQKKLNIEKVDPTFVSIEIRPLEKKECMNYIKAQKHLCQTLKDKVAKFFDKTWCQMFKFVYYPSNFDYYGLMSVIAASQYEQGPNKYIEAIKLLRKKGLLEDYILFMAVSNEERMLEFSRSFNQLSFYREIINNISPKEFIQLSLKYFHLVTQQFFKDISTFLISLLMSFVKMTIPRFKQGIALFEATTDCSSSVTCTFFKRTIEKCISQKINEKLQQYFSKIKPRDLIEAGLNFVKNILTCFYLYDVLDYKDQIYNSRIRNKNKETSFQQMQMIEQIQKQQPKQMEIGIEKEKDPERQWQLNIQADRKSQALILCLLIINNAIILRKHDRSVIQIDRDCELEDYFEQNLGRWHQRQSLSFSTSNDNIASEDGSQILSPEEESMAENVNDQDQRDLKVYQESDFVDQVNNLSRKGLLRLLSKILGKKPLQKIEVVCHSLTLQLTLQNYYMNQGEIDNSSIKILKKSISSLNLAIVNWQQSDRCKYRIAYDVMMCLVQIKTWCGRDKINYQTLQDIKECKWIFKENRKIDWIEDQKSNQTLRIIRQLSVTQDIYEELKKCIQAFQGVYGKKPRQQKYLEGLEECLKLWHEFKSCVESIKQQRQMSKSYLALFNMKNLTQANLANRQLKNRIGIYVQNMLEDLDSMLEQVLKELSQRLLVLFVGNSKEQDHKFMVDFDTILEKNYSSYHVENKRFNTMSQNQVNLPIIRIKMLLNKNNIDLLERRGGCKFLIINGINSVEIRKSIRVQQKSPKFAQESIYESLAQQFLKLRPHYIFLSILKDNELAKSLKQCSKNEQIIRFDCKKLHNKPDNALKCALMITLSLAIAVRINQENNFPKALQKIYNGLKILYRYRSNQQQHEPQLQFRTFTGEQIKSILIIDPMLSIQEMMEENAEYGNKIIIDCSEIIKEEYLQAIKSILSIIPMEISKKSTPNIQKSIDQCAFQVFTLNLKFYLKENENLSHFFQFVDEDPNHASLTSSQSKEHTMTSKFFQELLGQNSKKFLSIHDSDQKMIVVIRNFTFNRKQAWMNEEIKNMFFETQRTRLKTRYVKIGHVPCLISIRN